MRASAWLAAECVTEAEKKYAQVVHAWNHANGYPPRRPPEVNGTYYPHGGSSYGDTPVVFVVGPNIYTTKVDGDYTADIHAAIDALIELDPRVAAGQFFKIEIIG